MWEKPKYLVVETAALPEVFSRVMYAKHLIESGQTGSYSDAAKQAEISRSALYKYKDSVFAYERSAKGTVVSFYFVLRDKPGILSALLGQFYQNGANVLTINQNIPVDGMAPVSVSVSMELCKCSDMDLLSEIRQMEGVVEARLTAPIH